jgi:hypothetical protein
MIVCLLSTIVMLSSCREEKPPLSVNTMSKVLEGFHLADVYARYLPVDSLHPLQAHEDSLRFYQSRILHEQKLEDADFRAALHWYQQHPVWLDSVYQLVLNDLSVKAAARR